METESVKLKHLFPLEPTLGMHWCTLRSKGSLLEVKTLNLI